MSHAMHLEESPTTGDEVITNYTINFGPQHPAAHGVLRMVMELDGEIIERIDPHVGLLHRGTEKLIEHKTYLQALPYFDRLDYCSPLAQEYSYVLAIEKLLNVEVPERAQYLRVLFAELTRICNHMLNIGAHVMDVGAMTPNLWVFELREDCMNFFERASGARMHSAWFRPGGVHQDVPEKLLVDIGNWVDGRLQELFGDAMSLVLDNRIFKQRNVDIAVVSKDDAVAWGFSGPMIRAAGIPWDLRKSQPYDVYERMEFDIPVGTNSDCYDRFVVRVKEVYESAKIIKQFRPGWKVLLGCIAPFSLCIANGKESRSPHGGLGASNKSTKCTIAAVEVLVGHLFCPANAMRHCGKSSDSRLQCFYLFPQHFRFSSTIG